MNSRLAARYLQCCPSHVGKDSNAGGALVLEETLCGARHSVTPMDEWDRRKDRSLSSATERQRPEPVLAARLESDPSGSLNYHHWR